MNEVFDKSILSISFLFVITLIIYILFSGNNEDEEENDNNGGFSFIEPSLNKTDKIKENDPFAEYGTFYGTRKITKGFSFTEKIYDDDDSEYIDENGNIIEGINWGKIGDSFKKAFNPDNIKRSFEDLGHDIKGGLDEAGRKAKELADQAERKIKEAADEVARKAKELADIAANALLKPFLPMIEMFAKIKNFFDSINCRINHFNKGFQEFGTGVKSQFDNLGKSLKLGFSDIFSLIGTLGTCGIHFLQNLGNCIFYYILEMIGYIIYTIMFVFPMYVIKSITGIDMMSFVNQLWKMLYYLDNMLHSITGMHFMHYPDSIVKQCYTCKFMDKVKKINTDWGVTIPKLLNEPVLHFKHSGRHFEKVVNPDKTWESPPPPVMDKQATAAK